MTPEQLALAKYEFLEKAGKDPAWLITCMQDTKYDLCWDDGLTLMVYFQAVKEGCIQPETVKDPRDMKPQLTQWLIDLHNEGEGVTFRTLKKLPHVDYYVCHIERRWTHWLICQLSGTYFTPKKVWVYLDNAVLDGADRPPEALCSA